MGDPAGAVTTGLLAAVPLPEGQPDPAARLRQGDGQPRRRGRGDAAADADFTGGGDRVRLTSRVGGAAGPFTVEAELLYQPIGYRWAQNLGPYKASMEPARFVDYYNAMGAATSARLAREVVAIQ